MHKHILRDMHTISILRCQNKETLPFSQINSLMEGIHSSLHFSGVLILQVQLLKGTRISLYHRWYVDAFLYLNIQEYFRRLLLLLLSIPSSRHPRSPQVAVVHGLFDPQTSATTDPCTAQVQRKPPCRLPLSIGKTLGGSVVALSGAVTMTTAAATAPRAATPAAVPA